MIAWLLIKKNGIAAPKAHAFDDSDNQWSLCGCKEYRPEFIPRRSDELPQCWLCRRLVAYL